MRTVPILGCLLAAASLVSAQDQRAASPVGDLACISTLAEPVGGSAEALKLTQGYLDSALRVTVQSILPDLKLDDACAAQLYFRVDAIDVEALSSKPRAYAAAVRLELRRPARLVANGAEGSVTVWDAASLIAGRAEEAPRRVREELEALLQLFGEAWVDSSSR